MDKNAIAKIAKNRRELVLGNSQLSRSCKGARRTLSQRENFAPFPLRSLRPLRLSYDCLRISAAFVLFMCGSGVAELRRMAISSATIATAISSGVMAPISIPTGA
jgi:hypothetical protein